MRVKSRIRHQIPFYLSPLLALSLSSCGMFGGSDSNDAATGEILGVDGAFVSASDSELVISSKLALIPPKEDETGLSLAETFTDDKTNVYVEEGSLEALGQAESILCFINQTRFETQVNLGSYFAVVDESLCKSDERDSEGGKSLMNMKVLVTREANAPLFAQGWIHEEEDGHVQTILFQLKIAEGSSTSNPLGIFRFQYKFQDEDANPMGGGLIESYRESGTSNVGLRFYSDESGGDGSGVTAANALMSLDSTGAISGGKVSTKKIWDGTQDQYNANFSVDFNSAYLSKTGSVTEGRVGEESRSSDADACIDRNTYNSVAYRYGLYNADGSRKNLNSGFQIEFEKEGKVRQGQVSYWGIWTQGQIVLGNGDEVNKVSWTNGEKATEAYKIVQAPGKLYKYTKNTITLGDLKGTDLQFNDWSSNSNASYIVQWNGTSFQKISTVTHGNNGEEFTPASGTLSAPDWGYNFYVPSLSANINIAKTATLSNTLSLSFHSQELVSGTQTTNLTLNCYSRCPKMAATNTGSQGWEYLSGQNEWEVRISSATPVVFTFDATTKNLKNGATAFQTPVSSNGSAWIDSGVLVTTAQLGSFGSANISPWELEGKLDTFYKWQSSTEVWGQYYAVKNAATSAIVNFDKPLEFTYTHSTANDYDGSDTYDGKKFRLNYGGFGEMWGIPWKLFDGESRNRPVFSIKNGTKVTDGAGTEYTVKALDVAQRLSSVDDANCEGLDPSSAPELPTEDVLTAFENDEEPADADSPIRVISGELLE